MLVEYNLFNTRYVSPFTLYFPAHVLPGAVQKAPFENTLERGHGEMILIVEDNEATRLAIVESLLWLNYRTLEAENGRVALEVFQQHEDEVALVLSDMVMP